jgi:transcriptional regulator with XRE-family HTH domain
MITNYSDNDLQGTDLERFGIARARDVAFDAVTALWRVRKVQGLTQKELAERIGRDQGWVSRYFSGPGNWTLKTLGAFVQGLHGELEVRIIPLEEPSEIRTNFDAYSGYMPDNLDWQMYDGYVQMLPSPWPTTYEQLNSGAIIDYADIIEA